MLKGSRKVSPTQAGASLLELAEGLLDAVARLRPLLTAERDDPRERITLLLRLKVLPELSRELSLPVFVGVQGGTNTGKSTVFNALAGKLLSPSIVVASATKHPLVYLHEKWKEHFLAEKVFPGIVCRLLEDPKELLAESDREDLLFFRFHDVGRLADLAIIDSPDFDSALESNAAQATRIAAISDVSVYVTTAQKYRDRVLIRELRRLLDLKARVLVAFNMVEEDIVFETLVDDLRETLLREDRTPGTHGGAGTTFEAVRLPPSRGRHPEEELGELLEDQVLRPLSLLEGARIKPVILQRTMRRLLALVEELLSRYTIEAEFKQELGELASTQAEECRKEYATSFRLSFPEETLAIRRVIGVTELGPCLRLSPEVEKTSRLLGLVGASVRRLNTTVQRMLVRLARSDEGALEASPTALQEYAETRNRADADQVLRLVEGVRVRLESWVRDREEVSALARELLRGFFTPSRAIGFPSEVRRVHAEALRKTGNRGEEWLPTVESWLQRHRGKVRMLWLGANLLKLGAGFLVAWALPPALGVMAFLSPLKWLYFALGYFLGAYLVAILVCLRMRRKRHLERARREAMAQTLRTALVEPLQTTLDEVVDRERLHRIRELSKSISSHSRLKGPDPSRSPPADDSDTTA